MEDILNILVQYGPYIGLAVVVAGLVQSLKTAFKSFFLQSHVGMRILPFIPLVLGMIGGLALPQPTLASKLMVGGAMGTMSSLIYSAISRTFASTDALQKRISFKANMNTPVTPMEAELEVVDEPGGPGDEVV